MRRLMLVGALVLVTSYAVAEQTMSGCGMGYMLLGRDSPDSRFAQLFAVTTNATFGTHTFGITSGTSGCNDKGDVAKRRETEAYAAVNFESLRREMALGQGDYVETFATLLGASETTRPALLAFIKSEYARLFPSAGTTAQEMLNALSQQLQSHPEFLG